MLNSIRLLIATLLFFGINVYAIGQVTSPTKRIYSLHLCDDLPLMSIADSSTQFCVQVEPALNANYEILYLEIFVNGECYKSVGNHLTNPAIEALKSAKGKSISVCAQAVSKGAPTLKLVAEFIVQ